MFQAPRSRFIQAVLLANLVMYLAANAARPLVIGLFGLIPERVLYMPWMLVTNMFIHADFWHLFTNMFFGLFMFGSYLERIIGERKFMKVYFAGGLAGGLAYMGMSFIFGIPQPHIPAIGASGAVFGVIGALVMLRPNMVIYFNLFFPMKLWIFATIYVLYSLIALPGNFDAGVAHAAHLGGLFIGLYLGKSLKVPEVPTYTHIKYY